MDKKSNDQEQNVDELARPARGFQDLREARDPRYYPGVPPIPNIGRADLDPFAGGIGGGMLFDPYDQRHFINPQRPSQPPNYMPSPSGMIPRPPPGARFDPFGPGGSPRRPLGPLGPLGPRPGPDSFVGRGPDFDHLRSFGYDGSPM